MKLTIKIIAILAIVFPLSAATAAEIKSYDYLRIFYYREGKLARESLFTYFKSIDVLAPQSYSLNASGKLSGSIKTDIISFAKNHNIKLMPLVTNGNFSQASYKSILDDASKQDLAINTLVDEAKKNNYWGWQIDFEQKD